MDEQDIDDGDGDGDNDNGDDRKRKERSPVKDLLVAGGNKSKRSNYGSKYPMECPECGIFLADKFATLRHKSRDKRICSMTGVVDSEYISRKFETIAADLELTNIENQFKSKQLYKELFNKK